MPCYKKVTQQSHSIDYYFPFLCVKENEVNVTGIIDGLSGCYIKPMLSTFSAKDFLEHFGFLLGRKANERRTRFTKQEKSRG